MNLKTGINYCTSGNSLGFRGVSKEDNTARLIPLSEAMKSSNEEIFFFFGVDVPAKLLPYIPDMSPGSDFDKKGAWHHYKIIKALFIAHLCPKEEKESFKIHHVLQVVIFEGEMEPRVFLDERRVLTEQGIITQFDLQRIDEILVTQEITLSH